MGALPPGLPSYIYQNSKGKPAPKLVKYAQPSKPKYRPAPSFLSKAPSRYVMARPRPKAAPSALRQPISRYIAKPSYNPARRTTPAPSRNRVAPLPSYNKVAPAYHAPQHRAHAATYKGGAVSAGPSGTMRESVAPPSGGMGAPQSVTPAPPANPTLENWRAGDSTYKSASASIDHDLQGLMQQLADANRSYNQDADMGLRNLGWNAAGGDGKGAWNPDDLLGSYGQSRKNMFNDYSGRGLMDSSFFGDAQQDMTRNFERQRNDMGIARNRTNNEFGSAKTRATGDANIARQQALADAAARYAAMYGAG